MILHENPSWEKSQGGGEFHYNLKFTRVIGLRCGMSVCDRIDYGKIGEVLD